MIPTITSQRPLIRPAMMRRHLGTGCSTGALCACLLLGFGGNILTAADWYGYHGGVDQTLHVEETGLIQQWPDGGPPLLWHVKGLGKGHSQPVVVGDTIYCTGRRRKAGVRALRLDDGTERWVADVRSRGNATVFFWQDHLYVNDNPRLTCLRAADGSVSWQVDVRELGQAPEGYAAKKHGDYMGPNASPLVVDGTLFFTTGYPSCPAIALDARTGDLRWRMQPVDGVLARAYVGPYHFRHHDRSLLVVLTLSKALGVDAADGRLLWTLDRNAPREARRGKHRRLAPANPPSYRDGHLLLNDGYAKPGISCLLRLSEDGSSVDKVWETQAIRAFQEGMVVHGDQVFSLGYVDTNDKGNDPSLLINGLPRASYLAQTGKRSIRKTGLVCTDWHTGKALGIRLDMDPGCWSGIGVTYADNRLYGISLGNSHRLLLMEATPQMTIRGEITVPKTAVVQAQIAEMERKKGKKLDKLPGGFFSWHGTLPVVSHGRLLLRRMDELVCWDVRASR